TLAGRCGVRSVQGRCKIGKRPGFDRGFRLWSDCLRRRRRAGARFPEVEMKTRALFFCLLSAVATYGQSRYFRIVEGDRYEYRHQDTMNVGGTGVYHHAREGNASVLVSDVLGRADSLWFTLRVRDSSLFICLDAPYQC